MSKYSGKCDFFDHLDTRGFETLKNTKVYIEGCKEPVPIKSYADAIPYFAHIITYYASSATGDVVNLTARSWVDVSEEKMLNAYLEDVLRIYRTCKRKKEAFEVETVLTKMSWCNWQDTLREIVERVQKYGKDATIAGLTLPMYQRYRDLLCCELAKYSSVID